MRILCLTPIEHLDGVFEYLQSFGRVDCLIDSPANVIRDVVATLNYDVIFCNPNKQNYMLDEYILKHFNGIILTASTGLNHINTNYCEQKGIKVLSHKNDIRFLNDLPSTAELAFGLMSSIVRNIPSSFDDVKKGNWDYDSHMGHQLQGKSIGIIGYGRLGKMMTKYCWAFGMNVRLYDPYEGYKDLDSLVTESDIISLHVHASDETKHMINKKVLVKQLDSGEDIKIPYYCKYFGMISMTGKTKKFYMDGDQKYFQSMNNENADIYYENNTAKVVYHKKYCFNKKHITAQITAYQRLIMLEKLLEMDFNKLVRICVDGIYYKEHSINLHKSFSHKTKMTFNNSPCEEYLSGILGDTDNEYYDQPTAKPRKFYKSELFDGEGGLGKTYYNIFIDKGLIDVCYIPHSWKLSTAQTKQLEREQGEKLQSSVHFHIFNKDIVGYNVLNKYSVILLDECSMLTEKQKQYIIKNTQGKVIFMGDIDLQLAPCEGEQMNRKGIDKITRLHKNWRFKDNKMIELNKLLRKNGDEKYIDYFSLGIKTITKDELKKQYKPEDIILNYYKENEYGDMFKDIEKYKVIRNTRDYKNGEIVFDKDVLFKEFRHGYTIHSVQGETFDKNIYIDIKSRKGKTLRQNRLFYTAISRARYFNQLFLIV